MSSKAEGAAYKGCVKSAILYWTERKLDGNFVDKEVNGWSNLWSTAHLKGSDLMLMLGLNEANNHLSMANSVRWYGHVIRREDGHVLKRQWSFRSMAKGQIGSP